MNVANRTDRAVLASQETLTNFDNSEDDSTPTGSMHSIGGGSVNSISTLASFQSAISHQDDSYSGSIGSFHSIGNASLNSISTSRSFKSAKSHTNTDFSKSLSNANSLRSLGTQSFQSCSTYASFKSAKSHTDNETINDDLTPTNSLRSLTGAGSIDSFQSFKSARSGSTITGDDPGEVYGSVGSLESFRSFRTFMSFKNAKSDLSLSETITGDNDYASLHRFCTNSSMEDNHMHTNNQSESEDEEDEDDLLDTVLGNHKHVLTRTEPPTTQDSSHKASDSTNITATSEDAGSYEDELESSPNQTIVLINEIPINQSHISSPTLRYQTNTSTPKTYIYV